MAQPKYVYETTFLVKRGTKEQWEKENPVLECGEIGYVIDENSIKIGDGSSYWTELGYVEDERLSEYGRVTAGQAEGVELGKKATSEGDQTQATGETSHAEGNKTIASARGAHAQGNSTEASGKYSHAEGEYTIASGRAQHVSGKYNIEDDDDRYAFIIGNGTSDSERSNAFMVDWVGNAKLNGYLDIKGLKGKTLTRDLYIGGAYNTDGDWDPYGKIFVDSTPLEGSVKNEMYISTMRVPKVDWYNLVLPIGSNYLYKLQITESDKTRTFDVNQMPIISAGTYGHGYRYNVGTDIDVIFGSKTRVDSSVKNFSDGFVGQKRLNFQKQTVYSCPSISFHTDGPAEVKIWWIAGENNRYFAIENDEGGPSRLEVSGNFIAHGPSEFEGTAIFEDMDINGRMDTKDIHVDGFIETSESIECGGSIKVDSEIKAGGTATFENDVKIKNNSNREHMVKLRDALNEALDFDFKKRIPFGADEFINLGANQDNLKEQIEAMREISATVLTFDCEQVEIGIEDTPIEIWKNLTLKGINEKPTKLYFYNAGDGEEFTIFKVMAPDLNIGFENVEIEIEDIEEHTYLFHNNTFSGTNITVKDSRLNFDAFIEGEGTYIPVWQLDGANSMKIENSYLAGQEFWGEINYFDARNNFEFGEMAGSTAGLHALNGCTYGANAQGVNCQALGVGSYAEGCRTQAIAPDEWYGGDASYYGEAACHAEGLATTAYGQASHAEGYGTNALGNYSHAEGDSAIACGIGSHAEGTGGRSPFNFKAINDDGVYELEHYTDLTNKILWYNNQQFVISSQDYRTFSLSKPLYGVSKKNYKTGYIINGGAVGVYSHSEGQYAISCGDNSHTQGQYTFSFYKNEDVSGKYNIKNFVPYILKESVPYESSIQDQEVTYSENYLFNEQSGKIELIEPITSLFSNVPINGFFIRHGNIYKLINRKKSSRDYYDYTYKRLSEVPSYRTEGKYSHVVGNGDSDENRSNSHTLDWDGNAWYAGDVYVGSTSGINRDEGSKKLATEEFVTNALSGVEHPTPDLTGYATEEFVNTAIQQNAYTLPIATVEAIGGVKVGDTLEISADGALNVKQAETPTELYLMSPGGLKFKITVSDVGALSAEQVEI